MLVLLFVIYLRGDLFYVLCHFVLVFFSPLSIAITSLGEERANLNAFRTFVRFVHVWICRFPLPLDVCEGLRLIANALNDYCTHWCKREHLESNAFNNWKFKIFKIMDERVLFYSNNLDLLPPKLKLSFRYLKRGIQEFHRKYVLAPADKAANNVVVV